MSAAHGQGAGVRIVESSAPAWDSAATWRLGEEPSLDFGPGESLYRIGTAIRLASGRMIVAQNSANEILIYSRAGELEMVWEGGQGPGEFREISRLFTIGEAGSILVYDLPQFRATVFDTLGTFVRSFFTCAGEGRAAELRSVARLLFADPEPDGDERPNTRGLIRPPRCGDHSAAVVHIIPACQIADPRYASRGRVKRLVGREIGCGIGARDAV